MGRTGRKRKLKNPSRRTATLLWFYGIRLTDKEPMPGYLIAQYKRHPKGTKCSCRTKKGKGHGPYYYRVWKEWTGEYDGLLNPVYVKRREYVPLHLVPEMVARTRQYAIDHALPRVQYFWNSHGIHLARAARELRREWTVYDLPDHSECSAP